MKKSDYQGILIIGLFYFLIELLGVTCPIKFLTGISCAGCGMSRAWLALLRGDLLLACSFHPLVWLPLPVLILMLIRKKLPHRLYVVTLWGVGTAFFAVYILRMLDPADNVVVFQPREGLIWKAAEFIAAKLF